MYDMGKSPILRWILYIEGELNTDNLRAVTKTMLVAVEGPASLERELKEHGFTAAECLFLADTDAAIAAAKRLGMAVAAYVNPDIPGQSYDGVSMVIEGFDEVDDAFLLRVFKRCHGIPWTIAGTRRCIIREFAMDDFWDLVQLYEQPGITYRIGEDGGRLKGYIEPLYPPEEEWEYQEMYIRNMYGYYGYGMWLVQERESGKLIGRAGLENREYPEGVELELGYLIHPMWQHCGIAFEVCRAIIDYAKANLDCGRLNLLTDAENTASVALAERLGFSYMEDTRVPGSRMRRYVLAIH